MEKLFYAIKTKVFFFFLLSLFLVSCSSPVAQDGDHVRVHYLGKLTDGTVFDSSEKNGRLLEFVIGSGKMISGFESAVKGMKTGETKKVVLSTAEAYGEWSQELVQKLSRQELPVEGELKRGDRFTVVSNDGKEHTARVTEVVGQQVTVDFNHPLAGKVLVFEITLEEIVKSSES